MPVQRRRCAAERHEDLSPCVTLFGTCCLRCKAWMVGSRGHVNSERALAIDATGHVFSVCERHSVDGIRVVLRSLPDTASVLITEAELRQLQMQREAMRDHAKSLMVLYK